MSEKTKSFMQLLDERGKTAAPIMKRRFSPKMGLHMPLPIDIKKKKKFSEFVGFPKKF